MYTKLLAVVFTILTLQACSSAETPMQVSEKYWQALKDGDTSAARKLVTKHTQESFDSYQAQADEEKTPVEEFILGSEMTTVSTVIFPTGFKPEDGRAFETVLVLEDGEWKIDAASTQIPKPESPTQKQLHDLAKQLSESMKENIEALDGVMQEGMNILNKALREGSKDMGESLLNSIEKLNDTIRESAEKLKKRNQQEPDKPEPEPEPEPAPAVDEEGLI